MKNVIDKRCAQCRTAPADEVLEHRQPDGTWRWTCPTCGQVNVDADEPPPLALVIDCAATWPGRDHEPPKLLAAVKLLERTGARSYRTGYSDPDDGEPTVWYAVATWRGRPAGGFAVKGRDRHEAAAALDPVTATLRLCEQVIDGGQCAHCKRPTIFLADADDAGPLDRMGCVYQWDPELSTFRRSCEGDHA